MGRAVSKANHKYLEIFDDFVLHDLVFIFFPGSILIDSHVFAFLPVISGIVTCVCDGIYYEEARRRSQGETKEKKQISLPKKANCTRKADDFLTILKP